MYLRVNLLGPGPRLIKKNLPGRGLTKVENHWTLSGAIVMMADEGTTEENLKQTKYVAHFMCFELLRTLLLTRVPEINEVAKKDTAKRITVHTFQTK
jgi:hypothetical protein